MAELDLSFDYDNDNDNEFDNEYETQTAVAETMGPLSGLRREGSGCLGTL